MIVVTRHSRRCSSNQWEHSSGTQTASSRHRHLSTANSTSGAFRSVSKVSIVPRASQSDETEAHIRRYIENLKTDNQFITDWPKQLKASMSNTSNGTNPARALPSNWLSNSSPGLYNNVHEALWSMRDNMWSDVTRIRNVLSDEW